MDLSAGALFASLIVSSLGMGLFIYGKRQVRGPQLAVGLALMAFPYVIPGALAIFGIASVLLVGLMISLRLGL